MANADVVVEIVDGIAVVRIDRPPVNALHLELFGELQQRLDELDADEGLRGLVLIGTGECFSAGLDLKIVPRYGRAEQRALIDALNRLVATLYGFRRPAVAAINGHAIAGGLVVALLCDVRIAADGPFELGLTEVRVGVPYPVGPLAVVRAELSPPVARRLILGGGTITPREALAQGVVDELHPPEVVLTRAVEVAGNRADLPASSFARIKRQLRASVVEQIEEAIAKGTDPLRGDWFSTTSVGRAVRR